jgi:hypothetical protein
MIVEAIRNKGAGFPRIGHRHHNAGLPAGFLLELVAVCRCLRKRKGGDNAPYPPPAFYGSWRCRPAARDGTGSRSVNGCP